MVEKLPRSAPRSRCAASRSWIEAAVNDDGEQAVHIHGDVPLDAVRFLGAIPAAAGSRHGVGGGCLAENRRSRLLVGSVITKSPPDQEPTMPSSPISPCPSCPPHAAGGHGCAVYSSSVTDAEWAILEPLLPAPGSTAGRGGRPEKHCRRVIVDAILYIVRGGIAWRQLPVEFPPAGTGARPRRSSTRRRYPPPTPCPDPAAAGMAPRKRTAPWM